MEHLDTEREKFSTEKLYNLAFQVEHAAILKILILQKTFHEDVSNLFSSTKVLSPCFRIFS